MNNSAAKVGEIFREAGTAFSKLSEMTMSLQSIEESPPGGKWTDEEVEMLRGCVNRFAVELNKISQHIKNRTMYHLRRLLEMDSGAIQDISSSPPRPPPPPIQPAPEYLPPMQPPTPQLSLNHYLQGFDDNNNDEDLLQSFNPGIVPPLPPEQILQPARIQHMPLFEFEDIQLDQINLDEINLVVPELLRALDDFSIPTPLADVSNQPLRPYWESNRFNEYLLANLGTLHAEPPIAESNREISGAFSSIRNETKPSNSVLTGPNICHFSLSRAEATWNQVEVDAPSESVPLNESRENTRNRQVMLVKAAETQDHDSSYTGQIKTTEMPSGQITNLAAPTNSNRSEERPFKFFNSRRTETTHQQPAAAAAAVTAAAVTAQSTDIVEEKANDTFDFIKYTQAKREEPLDSMLNFRRAIEKRSQDTLKSADKNKEPSPSSSKAADTNPSGFFSFRQFREQLQSRTNSVFGSFGNVSTRCTNDIPDEASTAQPIERSHSPLEIDKKATFLSIRAENKPTPSSSFSNAQPAQTSVGSRRSRRLSHTTAFTDFITIPAAESTSGRKRDQRTRSRRRKAPADSDEVAPPKRARKNTTTPATKALKKKNQPK